MAGHTGLVGSALMRRLAREGCALLTVDRRTLDLRDQAATERWIKSNQPDGIIMAAAAVGGIEANRSRPAEFLYDNLMMSANVIHAAAQRGVSKLLYLGSSCIYPRMAAQPIAPDALLTGPLEQTNEAYAIAKIAAIKLAQYYRIQHGCDFISAMPCNLYGPGDRFDALNSHVIPALMMKFHEAVRRGDQTVRLWGTGSPLREFMHVDDLAEALVFLLCEYSGDAPVNAGSGQEISIRDLALLMAEITGYSGRIEFDPAMPDGTPRKVLDSGALRATGWAPAIPLRDGLAATYEWYRRAGGSRAA